MAEIRAYRGADEPALLEVWAAAMPYDALDARAFRRRVLLDPNVTPERLLVAAVDDVVVGFVLAVHRREPFGDAGLQPTAGWITAFGVAPQHRRWGLGTALFDAAERALAAAGATAVSIAPYLPGYFVPGVDIARYADGVAFLERRGYQVTSRPMAMDTCLATFDFAPYEARAAVLAAAGVRCETLSPATLPEFLRFAERCLPYDWLRAARELLRETGDLEQFQIALADGEVIGYCQHEGEHFGPFGVADGWRGRGVGTVLLARCLRSMRRRGCHGAWVLWTSDETADRVYSRFGFRETRRFAVMRKALG